MIQSGRDIAVKKPGWLAAGSISASVFALMSATLGAGALTTHEAVKASGIPIAIGMFTLVFGVSVLSAVLIIYSLNYSKMVSMEEMSAKGFGFRFAVFFEICMILFCFGAAVSYLITVYDIYNVLMGAVLVSMGYEFDPETGKLVNPDFWINLFTNRTFILCAATLFVLLPLSLLDKVNSLRFTSFLGVSAVIFLALTVDTHLLVEGLWEGFTGAGGVSKMMTGKGIIGYLHTYDLAVFAFTCQSNVPAIYLELDKRTPAKMFRVIVTGLGVCFAVYVAIGFGGFLAFGDDAEGSLLNAFAPGFKKMNESYLLKLMQLCAFFGMISTVMFAYPLNIFPCRSSVLSLLFRSYPHLRAHERRISMFTAFLTVAATLGCAIFFKKICMVMSLAGCTAGAACCVIAPALFFLKFAPGGDYDPEKYEREVARLGLEEETAVQPADNELLWEPNHGAANVLSVVGTPSFFAYPRQKSGPSPSVAQPGVSLHASILDPTLVALAPAVDVRGLNSAQLGSAAVRRGSVVRSPDLHHMVDPVQHTSGDDAVSLASSSFADESAAILPPAITTLENAELASMGVFDRLEQAASVPGIPSLDANGLSPRQIKLIRKLCKFLVVFGTVSAVLGTTCWILDNYVLDQ